MEDRALGADGGCCWSEEDILEMGVVEKGVIVVVVVEIGTREELVERMSEGVFGLERLDEVVRRLEMGRRRRAYIKGKSCWR